METDELKKQSLRAKLLRQVIARYILSLLFVCALLFVPAGTLKFWNAWVFILALFIPMFFVMIYLLKNDPELLQKRIKTREKEGPQKVYLVFSIITSVFTYLIPGLDYRYHWSSVPAWLVILATIIMLAGYFLFFTVMRQNSYASRVIEMQNDQKLIDTGLYSVVRHPMYTAGSILFCSTPLILGSYYALIPVLFLPVLLIIRALNEEKVLKSNLAGYEEYMKKVKYRLIPFIW
jgi:protein-S-isoprenylcysteine O-methyltransferase Ste14